MRRDNLFSLFFIYTYFMGRATGTLDLFSSVLGDRRGGGEEEQLKESPFAPHPLKAEKMMLLVDWFRNAEVPTYDGNKMVTVPLALVMSRLYHNRDLVTNVEKCQKDLESLVSQNICGTVMRLQDGVNYILKNIEDWPEEHRQAYLRWSATRRSF